MSKHRQDKINIIDVECTCWENEAPQPYSEIIEIGRVQLDTRTLEVTRHEEGIIVCPTVSSVSEFCTRLTGHTHQGVLRGVTFREACQKIRSELQTGKFIWASWGDYDRRMFLDQCQRERVGYPFGPTHFNLKALYALWTGRRRQCSVEEALRELDLEFEGRPHNGQDDTNNIARIAQWLLGNRPTFWRDEESGLLIREVSANESWCPDCGAKHQVVRPGKTQPTCDCHETCPVHGHNKIIYHSEGTVEGISGYFCLECWREDE